MTYDSNEPTPRKPLRLWPGVAAAVLLILVWFVVPIIAPKAEFFGLEAPLLAIIGGLAGALAIVLWWMFFSRAPWSERLGALVVMIVAIVAIRPLTHISIQNGMMDRMFFVIAAPPTVSLALVAWAVASRRWSDGRRRMTMVAAILLGCAVWLPVRTDGILGGAPDLAWRWTPTAEERLLAQTRAESAPPVPAPAAPAASPERPVVKAGDKPLDSARGGPVDPGRGRAGVQPSAPSAAKVESASAETAAGPAMSERGFRRVEWPGFRGSGRDSIIRGVRIETDWSKSPPVALWRRPIGPGWSSFAVSGDRLYTQEQRGDDEIVACYEVSTGKPVWMHRDATRFWESNGGAGPRGTPTLNNGRVYSLGATGVLNALDAADGAVVWSRNAASDTGVKVPGWGFTSSPLVVDDVVIVATSGALVAYDRATGDKRWFVKSEGGSYSSPQLVTIGATPQILLMGGAGATSVAPGDGTVLWKHAWAGSPIVQPAMLGDGDLLVTTADAMGGLGVRRLSVARGPSGWTVEERWTSRGLKPYFNDFVVHKGHAFGFDGNILACIDLADGTRKWKGGRYGNGQLVLLPDQDLMLVMSEEGELALVKATPDQFTELAKVPAIEGKTWSHPVLVGEVLLVRNGQEMAAFRLSPPGR